MSESLLKWGTCWLQPLPLTKVATATFFTRLVGSQLFNTEMRCSGDNSDHKRKKRILLSISLLERVKSKSPQGCSQLTSANGGCAAFSLMLCVRSCESSCLGA